MPTLIEVRTTGDVEESVRVWTGHAMVRPLVRHLGMRDTVAVTRALGRMRQEAADDQRSANRSRGLSRRALFQVGAGAVVAAAILSGTGTPGRGRHTNGQTQPRRHYGRARQALSRVLVNPDVVNVAPTQPCSTSSTRWPCRSSSALVNWDSCGRSV